MKTRPSATAGVWKIHRWLGWPIWLVQRGSPESKKPGDEGMGTDKDQKVGEHADPDSPD